MSISVRLNSFSDNWYGARAVIEEELKAISKALERIRVSSQLQDEFTEHLLAVHRQWCEACPSAQEPCLRGGGPLDKEAQATCRSTCTSAHSRSRVAAAHNPQKHVSTSTETTDIGLQLNGLGEVDDNTEDIGESSAPLSMIWCPNEEAQSDVHKTLEEASAEEVVSTTFIKVEALEDDQYPDTLLKLERDQSDVDMDRSNIETTSPQRHAEEEPSQCIEADGTNNTSSALNCDVLNPEGVSDDQFSVGLDSNQTVQKTSRSDDGPISASSTLNCDVLCPEGVSNDHLSAGLDSNRKDQKTSRSDGKMIYQCSGCSKSYFCRNEFQKHLSTHSCPRPYQCSVCSMSFSEKEFFDTHMMQHRGEKPFMCDHCGFQCSAKETLDFHMRMHAGAYEFSSCDESFYRIWDMEHRMMVHSGEKHFKCDLCSYSSARKADFQVHRRTHTKEKPYECDCCPFRSATKQNLNIHMRIHTGEKPHECSLCGKRFTQIGNLRKHILIHTGQKPYKCLLCGKGFTQMGNCKTHMKTH